MHLNRLNYNLISYLGLLSTDKYKHSVVITGRHGVQCVHPWCLISPVWVSLAYIDIKAYNFIYNENMKIKQH